MSALTSSPAALRLFGISIAARLPLPMLTIGVLVHVQSRTGSFGMAGLAGGALAITQGVGGPWLGRLADRHGQTAVLAVSAIACGAGLVGLAGLPSDAPATAVLVLAAVAGFATPPVPACTRALLPGLMPDERSLRRAYAVDSATVELTWISGPPLVLGIGALCSTGVALCVAAGLLAVFTVLFAATRASRCWRPAATDGRRTGGALRSDGVRLLAFVMAGAGVLFGATEVGVAAAAEALGSTTAAGPLLGLWGAGGFAGGLAIAWAGGGVRSGLGLAALLAALAGAHLTLIAATGSLFALALVLVLAGTLIAPTCASAYSMVEDAAPRGTTTEAFAWMTTAVAIGTSAGAASAGLLADRAGPGATFLLAGVAAGAVAALAAAACHALHAPAIG